MAKNRSYLGDGVYASYGEDSICLELNCVGRPIYLNEDNWQALLDYARTVAGWGTTKVMVAELPCDMTDEELRAAAMRILNGTDMTKN